ncbi:MAG TPA: di-heme oxidoredictase family protein [Candidatus Limnocylindria bacterium]|nr:di-heme oxidoredictase family protein [Candidatus Limnocylindria bacterium]
MRAGLSERLAALAVAAAATGGALHVMAIVRGEQPHPPRRDYFVLDDTAVPDDPGLREQIEKAVDLRLREDFDRMLDARDPGELIEHATVSETALDRNVLGIDTLFVIGDELFGYAFRPENGWGRGKGTRRAADYTPRLRRVHLGEAGGPDAFGCFACHSKGGPDGAGTQTQNAFLRGDGNRIGSADQRNPPHVLGLGPIACLAREMSAELQTQRAAARERAAREGRRIEQALTTKGVGFGTIAVEPDGTIDYTGLEGVDRDLTIRPFGWKGHQATLRGMAEESLRIHQGLLSNRVQLAIREGTLDSAPYGDGPWFDVDRDGVSLEIDDAILTTVVGYLAQLEVPQQRPPNDPGLVDVWAAGAALFGDIGCAGCHVPTLELENTLLDARESKDPTHPSYVIDVAKDGEGPKIEPKYAGDRTPYLVHLFSDLKRHDMGEELATPAPQGDIPARVFLTRPLWGLAETAPYLHDGRAPTAHEAIVLHGGEAAPARDAYLALAERDRASVRVFLASLSRQPKLFLP